LVEWENTGSSKDRFKVKSSDKGQDLQGLKVQGESGKKKQGQKKQGQACASRKPVTPNECNQSYTLTAGFVWMDFRQYDPAQSRAGEVVFQMDFCKAAIASSRDRSFHVIPAAGEAVYQDHIHRQARLTDRYT
jgi:hypothetical protein